MKKLMIIAAVACVAIAANASTYRWQAAIGGVETVYQTPSPYTTSSVYYFLCTDGEQNTIDSKNALLGALRSAGGGYDTVLTSANGYLGGGNMTESGNFTEGLLESFSGGNTMGTYAVIIDTDTAGNTWAYFSMGGSGYGVDSTGTGSGNLSLDGSNGDTYLGTISNLTGTFGDNYDGWAMIATGAVPEPTSGLLLLLGVAGLALRRRRA